MNLSILEIFHYNFRVSRAFLGDIDGQLPKFMEKFFKLATLSSTAMLQIRVLRALFRFYRLFWFSCELQLWGVIPILCNLAVMERRELGGVDQISRNITGVGWWEGGQILRIFFSCVFPSPTKNIVKRNRRQKFVGRKIWILRICHSEKNNQNYLSTGPTQERKALIQNHNSDFLT